MSFTVSILGAGQIAAGYDNPASKAILTHAHAIAQNKNFKLLGFCDTNFKQAELAAEKWKTKALNHLIPSDVIVICTPDEWHLDSIKQALSLKPRLIILEKPIARTLKDAKKIIALTKNIPVQVNFSRRFIPEFQTLAKDISNYGNFLTGSGYYGKGFIHNGSHMLDLLSFLGIKSNTIKTLNKFSDFYRDDPTRTVKIGNFYMQGIDCNTCSIFELDLFFERKRVRITESGAKINDKNTQINFALKYLYKNIYDFLVKKEPLIAPINKVFNRFLYA
jgi:predicted dehydrogenase